MFTHSFVRPPTGARRVRDEQVIALVFEQWAIGLQKPIEICPHAWVNVLTIVLVLGGTVNILEFAAVDEYVVAAIFLPSQMACVVIAVRQRSRRFSKR